MVRIASLLLVSLLLAGCSQEKVSYSYRDLGFASEAEMTRAHEAGYHTRQAAVSYADPQTLASLDLAPTAAEKLEAAESDETAEISGDVAAESPGLGAVAGEETTEVSDEPTAAEPPDIASSVPLKASFDCAKATSVMEKAICSDAVLASRDLALATAYRSALKNVADTNELKVSQREWLKATVRECGGDVSCLRSRYEQRLGALGDIK